MRRGVFVKLMLAFLAVIAAATVTLDLTIRPAWEDSLRHEIERAMVEKTRLFAGRVQTDSVHSIQQLTAEEAAAGDVRATVIDQSGKVLADSQADAETMENHSTRPEFVAALHGQIGMSTRSSRTVGVPFLYVAAPISGGAVRMAYPLASVQETTAKVRRRLATASAIALLLAMALAATVAQLVSMRLRRIVAFAERVAAGDLSARIAETATDEIATVAEALDSTAHKVEDAFREVRTGREQLEILLNSMQEAVIAIGSDGKVLWANGKMLRLMKGSVRVGGRVLDGVRDPNFLAAVQDAIHESRTGTTRASSLLPGKTFQVTAAPMPPSGAVAVLHDLTDVERVEKTRRDFIANVSHELRTPLTSVQGYAEALLDSKASEDPNTRDFLEIIMKNASRMSRLTEDLLVLARVESGEQRFRFQPVSAGELLHEVVETLGAVARDAGMEIEIENNGSEMVMADPEAIHQVLSNLLRNAINYARAGKRIIVGAHALNDTMEFYVKDLGPGIASEHLPRLFERFYRVDKARSRESGGTGLGLAIVKHIVRAHGGDVRAESKLGHGATFYFTVPLATAEEGTGKAPTGASVEKR